MNISGLNRLVYYKSFGKRILLLGEMHSTENYCGKRVKNRVDIVQFLLDLLGKIPDEECLDIFLEGFYNHKKKESLAQNGLSRARNTLDYIKENTDYPKLRVHHVDTRQIPGEEKFFKFFDYHLLVEKASEQFLSKLLELVSEDDLLRTMDYFLTINQEENRKYFLKFTEAYVMLVNHKIATMNKYIRWESNYFAIVNKELDKLDKSMITKEILIENLRMAYYSIIDEAENKPLTIFELLMGLPMDVYVLSRLFIEFNKQRGIDCDLSKINNVIIFSGSAHTGVYERFLTGRLGIESEIDVFTDNNFDLCLPVPIFNFWN